MCVFHEHLQLVAFLISQILHLKGDRKDFEFVKFVCYIHRMGVDQILETLVQPG